MDLLDLPVLPVDQQYLTAKFDWYTGMDTLSTDSLSHPNDDDLQIRKGDIIVYTGDMKEGSGWAEGYKLEDKTKTVKGFPFNYVSEQVKPSTLERKKTKREIKQDEKEKLQKIFLSLAEYVVSDIFDQEVLPERLIGTANLIQQMNDVPITSQSTHSPPRQKSNGGGGRKRKKSKIRKRN